MPTWNYSLELVPAWCAMAAADHQDGLGGCWGISSGMVAARGEPHCAGCPYYAGGLRGPSRDERNPDGTNLVKPE